MAIAGSELLRMAWQTICVPSFGTEAPCRTVSTVPKQGRLRPSIGLPTRMVSLVWDSPSLDWDRVQIFRESSGRSLLSPVDR